MRSIPVLALALTLAACAGSEEADPPAAEQANADAPQQPAEEKDESVRMAETAWRVVGEDGAIYTTFFDPGGVYRDFKNGEPLQSGTWERREDGRLCFTPESEELGGECWTNDELDTDGTMRTTSDSGRTIELRQVTYIAPAEV